MNLVYLVCRRGHSKLITIVADNLIVLGLSTDSNKLHRFATAVMETFWLSANNV